MQDQKFQLTYGAGYQQGESIILSLSDIVLGRDPRVDIVVSNSQVSRKHARLMQVPGGYMVQDLNSTNGTFVDGKRLIPGQAYWLNVGQTIALGRKVLFVYEPVPEAEEELVNVAEALLYADGDTLNLSVPPEGLAATLWEEDATLSDPNLETGMLPDIELPEAATVDAEADEEPAEADVETGMLIEAQIETQKLTADDLAIADMDEYVDGEALATLLQAPNEITPEGLAEEGLAEEGLAEASELDVAEMGAVEIVDEEPKAALFADETEAEEVVESPQPEVEELAVVDEAEVEAEAFVDEVELEAPVVDDESTAEDLTLLEASATTEVDVEALAESDPLDIIDAIVEEMEDADAEALPGTDDYEIDEWIEEAVEAIEAIEEAVEDGAALPESADEETTAVVAAEIVPIPEAVSEEEPADDPAELADNASEPLENLAADLLEDFEEDEEDEEELVTSWTGLFSEDAVKSAAAVLDAEPEAEAAPDEETEATIASAYLEAVGTVEAEDADLTDDKPAFSDATLYDLNPIEVDDDAPPVAAIDNRQAESDSLLESENEEAPAAEIEPVASQSAIDEANESLLEIVDTSTFELLFSSDDEEDEDVGEVEDPYAAIDAEFVEDDTVTEVVKEVLAEKAQQTEEAELLEEPEVKLPLETALEQSNSFVTLDEAEPEAVEDIVGEIDLQLFNEMADADIAETEAELVDTLTREEALEEVDIPDWLAEEEAQLNAEGTVEAAERPLLSEPEGVDLADEPTEDLPPKSAIAEETLELETVAASKAEIELESEVVDVSPDQPEDEEASQPLPEAAAADELEATSEPVPEEITDQAQPQAEAEEVDSEASEAVVESTGESQIMATELVVPELGESVVEATVSVWHKQVGDSVKRGELVVELETDKVDLEVEATTDGVLESILAAEGQDVNIGDVLAVISGDAPAGETPVVEAPAEVQESAPAAPALATAVQITPVAQRMAEEHGLDISQLEGSGANGRITKQDVEAAVAQPAAPAPAPPAPVAAAAPPPPAAAPSTPPPLPIAVDGRDEERIKMSRRRRTIAKRLVEAQHNAAMLTTFNEIDMGAVMEIRTRRKESFEKQFGVRLGFMSFFTKAAIGALKAFPPVNAEIDGDEMILKRYYDIGMAIGAPEGLVVPVLRNADRMSFAEIEKGIKDYAEKARDNALSLADLQGGTFTITNGGVFGSMLSTPILNPPQVGILGLHKIEKRPVVVDDEIVIRPMMYVALSYDHRIVDGREAVQFLVKIKELIEDPETLLLEG